MTLVADLVRWVRTQNRMRLMRRRQKRDPLAVVMPPEAPVAIDLPVPADAAVAPESIVLRTSEQPLVSIVIPAYGQVPVTLRCLASLALNAPSVPHEVIVVEDASGDPAAHDIARVQGVRFLSNPVNLGFLRSCNAAVEQARGRYIFLLNNDTQVMPDAVDALWRTFERFPQAGLVGSKLVYPDGSLQEAGGIIWADGAVRNHGRNGDRRAPAFNFLRDADYISGAAIMVDAQLWQRLGGFDEHFCPAYFEDTDLAMQVRQTGRRVIYQPASTVIHFEGVSNGTDVGSGIKRYQVVNTEKFLAKWRDVLLRDHLPHDESNARVAAVRAKLRPIVLVTNDLIVQPDSDAGSRAVQESMDALLALGCAVMFWPENPAEPGQYAETLRQKGIEVLSGPLRPPFEDWIAQAGLRIDAAFVHRPEQSMRFLPALRKHHPRARVIFYGHDLHFRRLAAQAELENSPRVRAASDASFQIESSLWQQVDTSVYFSQEEVDDVKAQFPACDVQLVQPYCLEPAAVRPVIAEPSLIFVAGFGHPPNVDAAQWLVDEVMPQVWAQLPEARLSLVGSKPTEAVKALAGPRVEVTGWVTDERLAQLYASHRVAVVPLRFGAGVKHKVVEALAAGLPLVTTSIGAQGLADLDTVCRVRDRADELADQLLACLRSDALCADLGERGQAYISAHFSFDSLVRQHHDLLGARLTRASRIDAPVAQPEALAA